MDSWRLSPDEAREVYHRPTDYQSDGPCEVADVACKHLAEKILEAWQDWEHWNPDKDKAFSAKYRWARSSARTFGDWLEIEFRANGILGKEE